MIFHHRRRGYLTAWEQTTAILGGIATAALIVLIAYLLAMWFT